MQKLSYGLNEVPELFDSTVVTGTILEMFHDENAADVHLDDVDRVRIPFHYHCEFDYDEISFGHLAFNVDDEVTVTVKNPNSVAPERFIVGFANGELKYCSQKVHVRFHDQAFLWNVTSNEYLISPSNWEAVQAHVDQLTVADPDPAYNGILPPASWREILGEFSIPPWDDIYGQLTPNRPIYYKAYEWTLTPKLDTWEFLLLSESQGQYWSTEVLYDGSSLSPLGELGAPGVDIYATWKVSGGFWVCPEHSIHGRNAMYHPGCVYSDKTMAQVMFQQNQPVSGSMINKILAACSTIPDDGLDPFMQPQNSEFEQACRDLILGRLASLGLGSNELIRYGDEASGIGSLIGQQFYYYGIPTNRYAYPFFDVVIYK